MLRGARAALKIGQRAAAAFGDVVRVTAGVAGGPVRCGTLGCAGSQRFSMVGAAVPQAAALEQLVRRHAREHLWRAPVGGPYRVAVPHAMFEELRSHLAYECFDVAHLPAVAPAAAAAARGAAFATPNATSRGRKRAAPPASTQISAVAQLLGEIRVDERDNEWMYALHGATGDADGAIIGSTCADPKLMRAHDVGRAASRARAIFLSPTGRADADDEDGACADASGSVNGESDAAAASESPRAFGGLSLAATNRAFMLVADILRVATRVAADAAAQAPALSGSQRQPQPPRLSGSTLAIAIHHSPNLGSGTGGLNSLAPTLNATYADAALAGLLAQLDVLLEGAPPLDPTMTALRQLVSAAVAPLTQA
jgi:hypothetical protein